MDVIDLQHLASIIGNANGYLSVNKATDQLEVKGSSFFGRMVNWVRFKFNRQYQEATLVAKRRIMASLLGNDKYGEDFQERINNVDPKSRFFYEDKPLSARKVRRFIDGVKEQSQTRKMARNTEWINWLSGHVERTSSNEHFMRRCDNILADKISTVPGLEIDDVDLSHLHKEVAPAALHDQSEIAAIENPRQAEAHVDQVLSVKLDQRIAQAQLKLRNKLNQQLGTAGLDTTTEQTIAAQIADTTIATTEQLALRVNELIVKQIGDEFDDLLEQAKQNQNFNGKLMQLSEVKEQLQTQLRRQNQQPVSTVGSVRKQALQLLDGWVQKKQAAHTAIQQSQFAGEDTLLSKLLLKDPWLGKAQIESIQQGLNQALTEVYSQNRDAYEALGINKGTFLAKLQQYSHQDGLSTKLSELLKQAAKPDSLFDDTPWATPDIVATVREYATDVNKPACESYKKINALSGKITEHMYQTLVEQVRRGHTWDAEFIATANQLHIDTLTANNNQEFYKLLETSPVAETRIGSKDTLEDFTLNELVAKAAATKNIDQAGQRRQIIDAIIPEQIRTELLDGIERQLGMVQSRVMGDADAQALCQRNIVQFLRERKINFEDMRINTASASQDTWVIQETPL